MKQALDFLAQHDLTETNIESLLGYNIDHLNANLLDATIISAIKTSITQLESEKNNLRIDHYLGSFSQSEKVPLYANINRATFHTERKPFDFANYALQAAENGFSRSHFGKDLAAQRRSQAPLVAAAVVACALLVLAHPQATVVQQNHAKFDMWMSAKSIHLCQS